MVRLLGRYSVKLPQMNILRLALAPLLVSLSMVASHAQVIGGGTCSNSSLSGSFAFNLNGRQLSSSGTFTSVSQSVGTATFDGQGQMTVAMTAATNSNAATAAQQQNLSGPYTLLSNCSGTATLSGNNTTISLSLASYNTGKDFLVSGSDATYTYAGSGSALPTACAVSSLSGLFSFNANGWALSGSNISGLADLTGLFQFDGAGNLTANWTTTVNGKATTTTGNGTYALGSSTNCTGTASLTDSAGKTYSFNYVITVAGADLQILGSNSQIIFTGAGHIAFTTPSAAIVNAASYRANATPPGSVFTIFGSNLATGSLNLTGAPQSKVLSTSVTVNGETAPVFGVIPGQVNVQLPWDIPPGLATVVVKNGNTVSNAVAINVPTSAPGIIVYGTNHAVIQDATNNYQVNSETAGAKVGDTMVVYFTGGGTVSGGTPVTGIPLPNGLWPLTMNYSVTVAGKTAQVGYIGLTPGWEGLYQANFQVPTGIAAGDRVVQINVNGVVSNAPLMTISN